MVAGQAKDIQIIAVPKKGHVFEYFEVIADNWR